MSAKTPSVLFGHEHVAGSRPWSPPSTEKAEELERLLVNYLKSVHAEDPIGKGK